MIGELEDAESDDTRGVAIYNAIQGEGLREDFVRVGDSVEV